VKSPSVMIRLLLIGVVAASTALQAQEEPDPVISPTRGFHPAHSYSISDVESIDAATGALSLHIPITELPSGPAGFTAGLSLVYSSKYWETYPVEDEVGTFYYLVAASSGGWHLSMAPRLEVFWFEKTSGCAASGLWFQLRLVNPDGSSHLLLSQGSASAQGLYCLDGFQTVTTPTVWHSIDGSYLQLTLAAPGPSEQWSPDILSWTLSRNDGSAVAFDIADGKSYLRDRNGNTIAVERGTVEPGHNYEEMSDPFGRTIRMDHYLGGNDEVTQTGHDGDTQNPLQWTVHYTSFPSFPPPTDDYWCIENLLHTAWSNVCGFPAGPRLVSSLDLPHGLSYDFTYGSPVRYGELQQMTLPSGATVDYSYRLDSNSNKAIYFELLYNWVKTKTVSHDGTSEDWQYDHNSYGYFGSLSSAASVTSPDDGVTDYEFHELSYYYSRPLGGILQKITQPDGSTLERDWNFNFPVGLASGFPNPWIKTETRIQANSSGAPVTVYQQVFTSDKNGNITSREEHDASTLLRKVVMTYVNGATDSTNTTEPDPNAYTHTAVTSPRNLVELQEVQDPQNPQSPVVSRGEFDYQESVPAQMAGNLVHRFDWDSEKPGSINPCTSPTQPGSCALQLSTANSIQQNYTYTPQGNLLTETDPNGNTVLYSYDAIPGCPNPGADSSDLYRTGMQQGGVTSLLLLWTYEYKCVSGLREVATDPNGLAVTTEYDRYGRPTLRDEGGLRATGVTYDDQNLWIVTQEDVAAAGDNRNVRVARFDQLGRLRLTQQLEQAVSAAAAGADDSLGILSETKYQFSSGINAVIVSNPYRASDPGAPTRGWTATRRDAAGRVCAVETFPGVAEPLLAQNCAPSSGAAATASYAYDAAAAMTEQTITDPAGALRVLQSDVLGRLLAVIEDPGSENFTTAYSNDLQDNLIGVAQGATARSFAYSSLGRLLSAVNPESGTTTYSYDGNGNLLTRTAGGVTRTSSYDDQDRILTQSYNDPTPAITFTYDTAQTADRPAGCSGDTGPKGRLAKVTNGSFATFYFHNQLGYAVCTRQTVQTYDPFDFLYSPTPQGQWTTVEYPSGRTLATAFDDASRPVSVAGASPYASGVEYAAHGSLGQMTLGNGTVETAEYNAFLQLTSLKLGSSAGASDRWLLQNGFPAAGNNGNVLSQTVTVLNGAPLGAEYAYDGLNRLKLASEEPTSPSSPVCPDAGSHWCQQYDYDARGNRRVEAESSLGLAIGRPDTFGTDNRIADAGYGYDSRGNLNLLPTGERYLYDGENRQVVYCAGFVSEADCGNPAVTLGKTFYYYDGEGRRVGKVSGAVTQAFVYDAQGRLAAEYGGSSEVSGTHYVTADHLGTTRVITDSSKAVLQCRDYLPFGDELLATTQNGRSGIACYSGETGLRQKFTGKERDAESRLDYFGARYFSWASGRFQSPDPENASGFLYPDDPQSWNGYAYARNNPLKYTDPDGMVYQICQKDDGGKESNCTVVSDAAFGNFQEQNKNTLTFTGKGQVFSSGNQIGTYQQTSVDLSPGAQQIGADVGNRPILEFSAAVYGAGALTGATGGAIAYYSGATTGSGLTTLGTLTETQLTGQLHHAVSRAIFQELLKNPVLRNAYKLRDPGLTTRARDLASHQGYQAWHRALDRQVVAWLQRNQSATPAQFESFLRDLYKSADLIRRFPKGF